MSTDQLAKLLDEKLATTEKRLEKKIDKKFKQNTENFATKDYLDQKLENFVTKDHLDQRLRLMESRLKENFKFEIDDKFHKYTSQVLKGYSKIVGELEKHRQERTARDTHDERVDKRLNRLEKHTGLPPYAD